MTASSTIQKEKKMTDHYYKISRNTSLKVQAELMSLNLLATDVVPMVLQYLDSHDFVECNYNIKLYNCIEEVQQKVAENRMADRLSCQNFLLKIASFTPGVVGLVFAYAGSSFISYDAIYQSYGLKGYNEEADEVALEKLKTCLILEEERKKEKEKHDSDLFFEKKSKKPPQSKMKILSPHINIPTLALRAAEQGHIKTLQHLAGYYNHFNFKGWIFDSDTGIETNLLLNAIRSRQRTIAMWLLKTHKPFDLDLYTSYRHPQSMTTRYGQNALTLCIQQNDKELAYHLLTEGANLSYVEPVSEYATMPYSPRDLAQQNLPMLWLFGMFNNDVKKNAEEKLLEKASCELRRLFSAYREKLSISDKLRHYNRVSAVYRALMNTAQSVEEMQEVIASQLSVLGNKVPAPFKRSTNPATGTELLAKRWIEPKQLKNPLKVEDKNSDPFYKLMSDSGQALEKLHESILNWEPVQNR